MRNQKAQVVVASCELLSLGLAPFYTLNAHTMIIKVQRIPRYVYGIRFVSFIISVADDSM